MLQFRQKTKQGGAEFKPSYNDRAHVTYAEATKFAESLKITRKKIAVLRTATESAPLASFPLPPVLHPATRPCTAAHARLPDPACQLQGSCWHHTSPALSQQPADRPC